jgi:ATP-binding cassette subfamily A (ABC1) protein 3
LTVDQSLWYIGRVIGLSDLEIEFQLSFIKKTLDLDEYSKTISSQLSGGNQRKLTCAMSLLGCPELDFLDEPTTGVDPVSRRSLFKMLKSLPKCSMIMTTHRMDEAESLCDNIAIQINGRLAVYGSPGHLMSLYGQGYQVNFKSVTAETTLVLEVVSQKMPYLTFKETKTLEEKHQSQEVQKHLYEVKKEVDMAELGGLS